jgi:hypothetical protein
VEEAMIAHESIDNAIGEVCLTLGQLRLLNPKTPQELEANAKIEEALKLLRAARSLAIASEETQEEREARICASKGVKPEDLQVALDDYGYWPERWRATVGDYELGCKMGTGLTAEAAIEDLLDQLEEPKAID